MKGDSIVSRILANSDRIIRGIVGLAVILAGISLQTWLGLLGVVLLGSAITNRCPLFAPLSGAARRVQERK